MSRRRFILLLFLLSAPVLLKPASANTENRIVIPYTAPYRLLIESQNPNCTGSLWIKTTEEKLITDSPFSPPTPLLDLGTLQKGQELIFFLETDCATEPLVSTNPQQAQIFQNEAVYAAEWKGLSLTTIVLPKAPPHHPVIFVHGLGGHWTDWEEGGNKDIYFRTLKSEPYNYPEDFLLAYRYSDADGDPETYDNQGDIRLISKGMKEAVDEMAEKYYTGCEENCVDLVGFSLGGIVIRQYLNDRAAAGEPHKVRKAVTIASPHQGAWVLSPFTFIDSIPIAGQSVREAVGNAASKLAKLLGVDINLNSDAVKQIEPASDYIRSLNNTNLSSPQFTAIYGNIDMKLSQKIFDFELTSNEISLGDPVILPKSATGVPTDQKTTYEFSDPNILTFRLKPYKDGATYSLEVDILGLGDTKYEHRKLITDSAVVDLVLKELTQ